MKEPFQVTKIEKTSYIVTWYGETVYHILQSPVWNNRWKAFSKKPILQDDEDAFRNLLVARLKEKCEKAIAV